MRSGRSRQVGREVEPEPFKEFHMTDQQPDPADKTRAQHRVILDAAFDKFRRYGTKRVTMDEIARDLRISKKTLYENFPSKEALVQACVDRIAENLLPKIVGILQSKGSAAERLVAIMNVISYMAKNVSGEFISDVKGEFPHIWEEIDRRRQAVLQSFEKLYEEGIKAGEIHPQINPKVVVRLHMAVTQCLMNPDVLALGEFTPRQVLETVIAIFSRGVLVTPPAHMDIFEEAGKE